MKSVTFDETKNTYFEFEKYPVETQYTFECDGCNEFVYIIFFEQYCNYCKKYLCCNCHSIHQKSIHEIDTIENYTHLCPECEKNKIHKTLLQCQECFNLDKDIVSLVKWSMN
jgi:hypothetical protein